MNLIFSSIVLGRFGYCFSYRFTKFRAFTKNGISSLENLPPPPKKMGLNS